MWKNTIFTAFCYKTVTVRNNQNPIQVLPWFGPFEMPSTRSKKAKARRSRDADFMSDIENMEILLGSDQYNQIESDLVQMTNF